VPANEAPATNIKNPIIQKNLDFRISCLQPQKSNKDALIECKTAKIACLSAAPHRLTGNRISDYNNFRSWLTDFI